MEKTVGKQKLMKNAVQLSHNLNKRRIFIFCLIIIQSIGIRFFDGQGTILSIVIIILSLTSLFRLNVLDIKFVIFSLLFLLICKLSNTSFTNASLIYQFSLVVATYFFIMQYRVRPYLMQKEFYIALSIFVYHSLLGYAFYLISRNSFVAFDDLHKSFLNIFYVSTTEFMGFQRNTGFFWEPGVFQLAVNLYLFYCIKYRQNIYKILIVFFAVLSSFSTVGLIIVVVNFIYYLYVTVKVRRNLLLSSVASILLAVYFFPILSSNANAKTADDNTSGLVRLRDFVIGIELIKERPILGHGITDSEYLLTKKYTRKTEADLFTNEYIDVSGEMGGGFTNGILGLIAWYGIPMSLFLYVSYFKNKFAGTGLIERILFSLIPFFSLFSEPITYTSLFLMYPFSYWILKTKLRIQ